MASNVLILDVRFIDISFQYDDGDYAHFHKHVVTVRLSHVGVFANTKQLHMCEVSF